MKVYRSARKHGIADADIKHAVKFAVVVEVLEDEDFVRVLYLGPDHAGNLLEVVIVELETERRVIHAMPMTRKYRPLIAKRNASDG